MCKASTILENSKVRLVTVIGLLVFFVGDALAVALWMRNDALWKLGVEHQMESVRGLIEQKAADRWTRRDMRIWGRMLRDENAELNVPHVHESGE